MLHVRLSLLLDYWHLRKLQLLSNIVRFNNIWHNVTKLHGLFRSSYCTRFCYCCTENLVHGYIRVATFESVQNSLTFPWQFPDILLFLPDNLFYFSKLETRIIHKNNLKGPTSVLNIFATKELMKKIVLIEVIKYFEKAILVMYAEWSKANQYFRTWKKYASKKRLIIFRRI